MKVLVFGASGIIGQHMRLNVPRGVEPLWFRRKADSIFLGCNVLLDHPLISALNRWKPSVVVNLAGESNTDAAEFQIDTDKSISRNLDAQTAVSIASWCAENHAQYVHVSTQAVFSGNSAPYGPDSQADPINEYGKRKARADEAICDKPHCIIVRPTFVLGVRPIQTGRTNPAEAMLSGQQKQVSDRWFSPLFAEDAARGIWSIILYRLGGPDRIIHLGNPIRVSRFDVAKALGCEPVAVSHDDFPGIANRPIDTTYSVESCFWTPWQEGIRSIQTKWRDKQMLTINERAREIALFLGLNEADALAKLQRGFGSLHEDVTADFKRANPQNDDQLLAWYRRTEAYIWELSSYHCDVGWNYMGMVGGLVERLKNTPDTKRVLVLGDGIGDITLALRRAGFEATYHDLADSRTAAFADFRFYMHGAQGPSEMTSGWQPQFSKGFDAVISFDFLEHVTDVPAWTAAIREALRPGGLFCAQNAFGIGSGDSGSMPMHLARNDRFEKDWDPHLAAIGFRQLSSNWYEVSA